MQSRLNPSASPVSLLRPSSPFLPFATSVRPLPSKLPDTLVSFHFDRENAKAKKCLKNLSRSECTFSSSDQELIDLSYNDYNPFCNIIEILEQQEMTNVMV